MLSELKGWWFFIAGAIGLGTGFGVAARKVKTHDRVLFKEHGGLNVVDIETCDKLRVSCRRNITADIGAIIDKKLSENNNRDKMDLILSELQKLNKHGEGS